MKNILFFAALALSNCFFGQTLISAYQDRVNQVTQSSINSTLTEFSNLGVKKTGSAANNNAFTWLKNKYLSFGYTESQLTENVFNYSGNPTKNLILTKAGTLYPDTFVIVCGHYDTITGPGVNDNGSGTTILLEMARILKDVPTEYSIKFINFTGEEQGLLGSKNYVNTVVNSSYPKMNIKLVLNIDQVGGTSGEVNNKITCERDTNNSPSENNAASNTATQELINCIGLYSTLQTNLSYAYSSDYMPFQSNGEIITGLYEFNESSFPHSVNDTYANMDPVFVLNVCKGALGALQHFSVAKTTSQLGVNDNNVKNLKDQISLHPNPAQNSINIGIEGSNFEIFITDFAGKKIFHSTNEQELNISKIPNGDYLLTVARNGETVTKKFIIKR